MAGKFEVYKDKTGGYRFRLKAGKGERSPHRKATRPRPALNGVESVKKNAGGDVVVLAGEA
ncbi:YegP family protein [Pseudarthrobacter sp. S9]|uniref:YegP family protein n=1 Tax=Pseudarthrobacter sp. S9 TaxID=3418421 RepID=UPI003D00E70E